jgi:hypothetical protein
LNEYSLFICPSLKKKKPSYIRIPRNRCIQTKKKTLFLSITLTVVARRKGRHQKKKNSLLAHAQCSGTPQGAPPTKKNILFPFSLSVVARRKGRNQQKKTLFPLSLSVVESREWRHQQQNKPVRLIELTSPDFLEEPGCYPSSKFKQIFFSDTSKGFQTKWKQNGTRPFHEPPRKIEKGGGQISQ